MISNEVGSVTDVAHDSYRYLNATYRQVGADRSTDRSKAAYSPLELGAEEGSAQAIARESLVDDLNDLIGHTAARIGEHLNALQMLYQPTPDGLFRGHPFVQEAENQRAPRSAAFSVARGVLEGVALFSWVCGADQEERLGRTAAVSIWSAKYADQAYGTSTEDAARQRGKAAGVGVIPRFAQSRVIKDSLGDYGSHLYTVWSGRAHHAPWAGVPALLRRDFGHEVAYSSALEQPAHLELAADVTKLVRLHLNVMIDVLGKQRTPAVNELVPYEKHLREAAEQAAAAVSAQRQQDQQPSAGGFA